MAAGEDEPEPVVREGVFFLVVALGLQGGELGDGLALLGHPAVPAEPVDGSVPGGHREPGAGIGRQPVAGPALQRDDERLLDGLLGEVEVAGEPDERRDRPSAFFAEQAVDDTLRRIDAYSNSMTGRTSMDPPFAAGILAAHSMASSRSLQLRT